MPAYRPDQVREHEYDGIQEYDNRLPNWWLQTLYGAIVFAIGYWLFFHTWGWGNLPREALVLENARAAEIQLARMAGQEITDETLSLMAAVPARVESGREIFTSFCAACHRADGSGDVGPNLTDPYWLHGNRPLEIFGTVMNGIPDKGMASWKDQLGPRRVQDVVAFVLTIREQNLPGKAPQGEIPAPPAEASSPERGAGAGVDVGAASST